MKLRCLESRIEKNHALYGRFQLGPFERGQGTTIANLIRRALLSELSGLAIFCVEIPGVSHEYSTLKGVRDSVLDILLNLKQIAFISKKNFTTVELGFLNVKGPAVIKAGHLKLPPFLQCVDPNQYITTLADNGVLQMKFMICKGKNFLIETPVELFQLAFQSNFAVEKTTETTSFWEKTLVQQFLRNTFQERRLQRNFKKILSYRNVNIPSKIKRFKKKRKKHNFKIFERNLVYNKTKIRELQTFANLVEQQYQNKQTNTNVLVIDAVFMPIKNVNFSIQNINNYSEIPNHVWLNKFENHLSKEKVILEISTNGSIHPRFAIFQAIQKMLNILIPFQNKYGYKKNASLSPRILSKIPNSFRPNQVRNNLNFKNVSLHYQKNLKPINEKDSKLKFLDIAYLNLSTKSYICLKRADIHTINTLLSYSYNELLLINNLGKKSVRHIQQVLAEIGFKLRNEIK